MPTKQFFSLLIFITSLLFSQFSFGQNNFKPGLIVLGTGDTLSCFIKDKQWRSNPTTINYKVSESSNVKKLSVEDIELFEILNSVKYQKATVKIDTSNQSTNSLTKSRNPHYKEITALIKVVVEGKYSLFHYFTRNREYFFMKKNESIEYLVYKKYQKTEYFQGIPDHKYIVENNSYQNQLWQSVNCLNYEMNKFSKIEYNENSLKKHFERNNLCTKSTISSIEPIDSNKSSFTDNFNLSACLGMSYSKFSMSNIITDRWDADFDKQISMRYGIQFEYYLPFNNNKWSLNTGIEKYSYETTQAVVNDNANLVYNSLEVQLGMKYTMYITKKFSSSLIAIYTIDTNPNIKVDYDNKTNSIDLNTSHLKLGMDLKYDRYAIEGKIKVKSHLTGTAVYWNSNYLSYSFVFRYFIF